MKEQNWYFRNWQYENVLENGKQTRRLVYKGEYYRLSPSALPAKTLKGLYLALAILLCLDLAVLLTHLSLGAYLFFVGGAAGLALIPSVFLVIACVRSLFTPEKMTYRDLHASYHRIRLTGKWVTVLMGICLAGELFFVFFRLANGLDLAWGDELVWLIGGAAGTGIGIAVLILCSRNSADMIPLER